MVQLYASGREYIYATLTAAPEDGDIEVTTDGTTWHPAERVAGEGGETMRVLVQGPDADTPPGGVNVLTLPTGRTILHARLVDTPEILIRAAGYIDVRTI